MIRLIAESDPGAAGARVVDVVDVVVLVDDGAAVVVVVDVLEVTAGSVVVVVIEVAVVGPEHAARAVMASIAAAAVLLPPCCIVERYCGGGSRRRAAGRVLGSDRGAAIDQVPDVRRSGIFDGSRAVAPLLVGVIPFGLIFGVTAAGSVVGGGLGYATSFIIFAGAAQLATIQLLDADVAAIVVIATALVINARHLMYSAAMAPHFREFPAASRVTLPYLLTDQAFAVSIVRYDETTDPTYKRWFYFGAGITLWVAWQITTAAGVLLGAQVPPSWSLDFAIPLVFLALLIPAVRSRPALVAAVVGGGVALAASSAPYGLGLIVGAVSGVVAGVAAERAMQ